MPTPLYPLLEQYVQVAWIRLDREAITPWAFLKAGPPFRVNDFYGKTISYQGIEFDGSARHVFWARYIEPFLEDLIEKTMQETIRLAAEKHQDPRLCLPEAAGLLTGLCRKAFARMADIDQRLRGRGQPQTVQRRDVGREVSSMEEFIDRRLKSELLMIRKPSRINELYHQHPFWFWFLALLIGSVVTLLAG